MVAGLMTTASLPWRFRSDLLGRIGVFRRRGVLALKGVLRFIPSRLSLTLEVRNQQKRHPAGLRTDGVDEVKRTGFGLRQALGGLPLI